MTDPTRTSACELHSCNRERRLEAIFRMHNEMMAGEAPRGFLKALHEINHAFDDLPKRVCIAPHNHIERGYPHEWVSDEKWGQLRDEIGFLWAEYYQWLRNSRL
jgi:hypothetical protein